ncbi:tyrosine-type recombinase/integrase [Novosphingobium sp. B 225]|uniref:tyrosine-type recombinase/integrase n=1 Tax=Novosphingobium sp. B 225 TaxID=1961849 RepID=UPI0020CC5F99|nr:integrase arm-type DNA-binding domain-containing protein [Novosphingobium sp. B 225]
MTETRLRALKVKDKPYKVADQRGLYIEVTPSGGKLWRFRYRIGKVEKKLAIGSYPDISLKQAREATYEARHSVASGGDPAFEKRKQKIREEFLSAQTFEAVAREYIEQMMVQNGRADATLIKANYFLDQLVPAIGDRPIQDIEPFEVLAPLKRLEATGKHETAKKCRSFAGRVFRYAVATTRCTADPTSMLKGALVTPRAKHYAAILEPKELGGLLRAIDDYTGYPVTRFALQIAPHVFVRPGELRHAEWREIDLVEGIWKIPAGKMKARRAHAVPLLGNQVHDVKPRWAKGTAHRVARLLADHIDELERKDAQLGDSHGIGVGGRHG